MSHVNQNSSLRSLLSPTRSGTFFAPFRSRSANPDGFDSKMKLWVGAIEEWAVNNKKLILSLNDIHQIFVSDAGIRPDKECIRLVFSEMKRRSRLVSVNSIKNSNFWTSNESTAEFIDKFIDPKGWIGWGVKNLVYNPASWALSAISTKPDQVYSDLTDMSITDNMKFVCYKSLQEISQSLLVELIRITKAEKQSCFEWQHLLELITPIMSSIIDATDGKELLEMLDILIEYLSIKKHVAIQIDNESKLVKIANPDESKYDDFMITRKDIATARLMRAKELLTADADRYHNQAQNAKMEALESYNKKEVTKAKSLLRSHKRLTAIANQKETQLTNVEIMLDQLENTNSNMMILQAYKDGAEALKIANTNIEANTTILDEMYDVTAEARYLNDEMSQMLKDISYVSQSQYHNQSQGDLEAELNDFMAAGDESYNEQSNREILENNAATSSGNKSLDDLEERLNNLEVCQHEPNDASSQVLNPTKRSEMSSAT